MNNPGSLAPSDAQAVVDFLAIHAPRSGRDGELIYNPFSDLMPFETKGRAERYQRGYGLPVPEEGWRRGWAFWGDDAIVAVVNLHDWGPPTRRHRCWLSLGVLRQHRRRGLARALMHAALDWARAQPTLEHVDLGVFANNAPALALYRSLGFEEIGRVPDHTRVWGASLTDVQMTLSVR